MKKKLQQILYNSREIWASIRGKKKEFIRKFCVYSASNNNYNKIKCVPITMKRILNTLFVCINTVSSFLGFAFYYYTSVVITSRIQL